MSVVDRIITVSPPESGDTVLEKHHSILHSCPACKGRGSIVGCDDRLQREFKPCPRCQGTGKLDADITIAWSPSTILSKATAPALPQPVDNLKEQLLADRPWVEQAVRQSGLGMAFLEMLPEQVDLFLSWIAAIGEQHTIAQLSDAKRRFVYWWRYTGSKDYHAKIKGHDTATSSRQPSSDQAAERATNRQSYTPASTDYQSRF